MRNVLICSLLYSLVSVVAPAALSAEEATGRDHGQGYAFVGFGAVNSAESTLHFGAGVEPAIYKGLGLGVEVGYLGPARYLGEGIGILSLDGQFTFARGSSSRLRPFLTGGYTLAFRSGTANAVNFGGGLHYWFKDHIGLRLEFRDHVSTQLWNAHAWQGRVGVDFR